MRRAIFDILLFLCLFIAPWWCTALLAFSGLFIFRHYYEFLIAAALSYALYQTASGRIIASPYWYPLIICAIYLGVEYIRHNIIFYNHEI